MILKKITQRYCIGYINLFMKTNVKKEKNRIKRRDETNMQILANNMQ